MTELTGRVALVTGGSRGIGAAAGMALAAAGAAVMLVARDGAAASRVAGAIADNGGKACGLACDVADYDCVERIVDETEQRFGRADILINNAGVIEPIEPFLQSDPAAWQRNIEINLIGAYNAVRAILPRMVEAGGGTVVNLSSGAAHRALEGWSAYCAAKAGLAMLTNTIILETAGLGIRVFGLAPGVIDTDLVEQVRASGINHISRIPRADLAPVEHPAAAVVYLCSEAADDLIGKEVLLRDPEFRRRIGLT